jgi:hypothetical protein
MNADYRALVAKVDAHVAAVHARNAAQIRCELGCHGCCAPGLSVSRIERENIAAFLRERPELVEALRANEAANPHQGERCSLLLASGACGIYEARPIICRTHGTPIEAPRASDTDEDPRKLPVYRDVCPLNFEDVDLASLETRDVLRLATLDLILATLNRVAFGDEAAVRYPLSEIFR